MADLYDIDAYTNDDLYRLLGFDSAPGNLTQVRDRIRALIAKYTAIIEDDTTTDETYNDAVLLLDFLSDVLDRFLNDTLLTSLQTNQTPIPKTAVSSATAATAVTNVGDQITANPFVKLSNIAAVSANTAQNAVNNANAANTQTPIREIAADGAQSRTDPLVDDIAAATMYANTAATKTGANDPVLPDNASVMPSGMTAFSAGLMNPIKRETISRVISLDSKFRDTELYPRSTDFTCSLTETLRDVVSLQLYFYHIPYTWYNVSNAFGDNFIYIVGTSPGLDVAAYSIQLQIARGSYGTTTLIDTLNTAIIALETTGLYADISFTGTSFTFANTAATATLTMNMMQRYNESSHYIEFPGIDRVATTVAGIDMTLAELFRMDAAGTNDTNMDNAANTNVDSWIFHVREIRSPILSVDATFDTATFTATAENTFFTVYHYTSSGIADNPLVVSLDTLIVGGSYTRAQWLTAVNAAIITNQAGTAADTTGMFSTQSRLSFKYTVDTTNGYYCLTIEMNRKNSLVKKEAAMYVAVSFPDDIVWRTQTDTPTILSCFGFIQNATAMQSATEVKLRTFTSNRIPTLGYDQQWLSYTMPMNATMYITCNQSKWKNLALSIQPNDFIVNLKPVGVVTAANIDEFMTALNTKITSSISKYNTSVIQNDKTYATTSISLALNMVYNTEYMTSVPRLLVNLSRRLTWYNFNIAFTPSTVLSTNFFKLENVLNEDTESQDAVTSITNATNSYIRTYTTSVNVTTTGELTNGQVLFTLQYSNVANLEYIPGLDAAEYNISINTSNIDSGLLTWIDIPSWTESMNAVFNNLVLPQNLIDAGISVSGSVSYALASSNSIYDITLTLTINAALTEVDYSVSFSNDEWNTFFRFPTIATPIVSIPVLQRNVDMDTVLNIQYTSQLASPHSVAVSQIYLTPTNNYFYVRSAENTVGLYTVTVSPEDVNIYYNDYKITLTLATGNKYTHAEIIANINARFAEIPQLVGSYISADTVSIPHRTEFKLMVNKEFTHTDYKVVFYDMDRFTTCAYTSETNSKTLNSSRYSTIGWTLGFRNDTEYTFTTDVPFIISDTAPMSNRFDTLRLIITDYVQSTAAQGIVTIKPIETTVLRPSYADYVDRIANTAVDTSTMSPAEACAATRSYVVKSREKANPFLTKAQLVAANLVNDINVRTNTGRNNEAYSKDAFAIIPLNISDSATTTTVFSDYGRSLQVQERVYFGPVNISKFTIRLLTPNGDILDLNNADWGVALLAKQLYGSPSNYNSGT